MKAYPAYKDNIVEWIGEIPSQWHSLKLKRVVDVIDGDRGKEYPNQDDFVDHGIPFLSSKNIIHNRKRSMISSKILNISSVDNKYS